MLTALITGVTGQDGAYLAKRLIDLDYRVVGACRRSSTTNFWRLEYLGLLDHPRLELVDYDLTDVGSMLGLIRDYDPQEIYNLAAQSFVGVSFTARHVRSAKFVTPASSHNESTRDSFRSASSP